MKVTIILSTKNEIFFLNSIFKVNFKVKEGLQYIQEDVDSNWALVYEDGDMKVCVIKSSF